MLTPALSCANGNSSLRARSIPQRSLAEQREAHHPSQSALACGLLFVFAIHFERHAARHGDGRIFAFGASVRSRGLRRTHHLRQLARTGYFFTPGSEILLPAGTDDVVHYLDGFE